MRPAYVTRCPDCLVRIEIEDKWQESKIKVGEVTKTIVWFDPDRIMSKIHSC